VRLSRLCPLLALSLFLSAQASLATHRGAGNQTATSPFLAPVRMAGQAVSEAFDKLRAVVLASPLAKENRLSPEEERRAHVALWTELETGQRPDSAVDGLRLPVPR